MELKKICGVCGTMWTYDFPTCVFCGGAARDLSSAVPAPSAPPAPPTPAAIRRARPWWKIWVRG